MKRSFYVGLMLFALASVWIGRAAWRAYYDLVSLEVRNMPVAEVIRQMERQTREKIVTGSQLDAQITLNIRNLPLSKAIDRVAEQADAVVTTVHAVYRANSALNKLLAAAGDGQVAKAQGWTNLAPNLNALDLQNGGPGMESQPVVTDRGAKRLFAKGNHDVFMRREGGQVAEAVGDGSTPVIRVRSGDAPEEIITPERLMMEATLDRSLKKVADLKPDEDAARAVAQQVRGKYSKIYTLRKTASAGLMAEALRHFRSEPRRRVSTAGDGLPRPDGDSLNPDSPESLTARAERDAQRNGLRRYQNLTPEQRAQRARERREQGQRMDVDVNIRR